MMWFSTIILDCCPSWCFWTWTLRERYRFDTPLWRETDAAVEWTLAPNVAPFMVLNGLVLQHGDYVVSRVHRTLA